MSRGFVSAARRRYRPLPVRESARERGTRWRPNPAPVAAALILLAGAATGLAQPAPTETPSGGAVRAQGAAQPGVPKELEGFEGRPIRSVQFRSAKVEGELPLDAQTEDLARNQLRLRPGQAFDTTLVSEDVARLNRLARFQRVEARVQLLQDGSVDLIYVLSLQPIVQSVQVVGNKKLDDDTILNQVSVLENTPVDPTQLDRAARRIEESYRAQGYYNALVTVDEEQLRETGIVLFVVREGERTKITDIRFEGNLAFAGREVRTAIKTKEAWLLSKGRLDPDQIAGDVASIIEFYKDRGYLDVRADSVVTLAPNGREAIVTFVIDEGPRYTLRDVRTSFAPGDPQIFDEPQLLGLMTIKPGDVYSLKKLDESVTLLKSAYHKLGYTDAVVRRRELRDPDNPVVDVLLVIDEGERFRVGEVIVRGNTITRDDVVRRNVTIQPDRPMDRTEAEETERRLRNSRLFAPGSAKVTIQPEDPEHPGYRDVLVEVDETNTGEFAVGGAVSSDAGLYATISLTQRNFDITDTPDTFGELFSGDAFRGGGQTFTIAALPGDRVRQFSVSLTDPYLFETDYSGGASAYYRQRLYRAYDEERYGGSFRIGRRFGSRWQASIPFRLESVALSDIDEDAPTDYYDWEERQNLASVGLTLSRSTLNNPFRPTAGNVIEMGVEQFGGVSDVNFTRLTAGYNGYFSLSEDIFGRRTVLNLNSKIGWIPQDGDDVPFYEKFYLGGRSFRGFAFRAVSPVGIENDSGEVGNDPVGGNFSFFLGLELEQPVYEDVVSVVGFIDTGTVTDELSLDDYRVSVGAGLRLYVPQLSTAPLAFDFGFPLIAAETDREQVFTFSIDVPFN